MAEGWVKVYRDLFDKPIWLESTPEQKVILVALLGIVNHAPRKWEWKGRPYLCQAGQKVTSVKGIQKVCGKGITRQNVRTALRRFEKLEFLTVKTTKQSTLISICNWDIYQRENKQPNQDANHHLTNDKPSPNHRLTNNKKYKKPKKEKKKTYSPDSNEYRLSKLLLDLILERKADFQKPNLQNWAVHIDRMIRLDNRKPEKIREVILWCQQDEGTGGKWKGWQDNILSTEKLREKFDQLELEMNKRKSDGTSKYGGEKRTGSYIR